MLANLVYLLALTALSPLIAYRALRFGRYRRGIREKLLGLSPQRATELTHDASPLIWLHAVSVGEVNLLPGVVDRLRKQDPSCRIAISTSTDSGYDLAVKRFGPDRVFFCPLDFTWSVRNTLRRLRPSLIVLAELELWPNLIRLAEQNNCPVVVINARLSERSAAAYARFAVLTRSMFRGLVWVGCQDPCCAERFESCGVPRDRLQVTGSLKYDNAAVSRDAAAVQTRFNWAGVDAWHRVWCFGSTQPGEEAMALRTYRDLISRHPDLRLILVPRHPQRFEEVANQIRDAGFRVIRRSLGESQYADTWDSDEIILIDTVGELGHWWGVCHIATVGGSFGTRGGQNMLEPAGYGCAVSFGPDTRNFAEIAKRLIHAKAAVRVADEHELSRFVERCVEDPRFADKFGQAAQRLVWEHRGATDKTVAAVLSLLRQTHQPSEPGQARAA